MIKLLLSIVALLIVFSSNSFTQDISNSPKKIRIESISFFKGSGIEKQEYIGLDKLALLAPSSSFLTKDFTGYTMGTGWLNSESSIYGASALFKFRNKENVSLKRKLRIGIIYYSGARLYGHYHQEDYEILDTFNSPVIQEPLYVANHHTRNLAFRYSDKRLQLHGSYILPIRPASRFSFFIGAGISAGISVSSTTFVKFSEGSGGLYLIDENYFVHNSLNPGSGISEDEEAKNKTNFNASAYIPIGVDFRLSNSNFLQKWYILLEFDPGISYLLIPEVGNYFFPQLDYTIGLRFKI